MNSLEKTQMKTNVVAIDYHGLNVNFTSEAWFNATEVAKRFDKEPFDWLRQRDTVAYVCALAKIQPNSNCGFLTELNKIKELDGDSAASRSRLFNLVKKTGLVRTKSGSPETGGGTWLHPKLAVRFAQWLDVDFAVWCDEQIDRIIKANYSPPSMMQLLLANNATKWELRFSPEFYSALAKVTKTKYNGHSQGTPCVFGQITLKWVYQEIMPDDVLAEVKARKNNSEKIHQWLSNGGQKLLDQQIAKIQAIALSSVDYKDFDSRCYQACKSSGQLRLVWAGVAA